MCSADQYEYFKEMIDKTMVCNADEIEMVLLYGMDSIEDDHRKDKPLSSVFGFHESPGSNFRKFDIGFVSMYAQRRLTLQTFKSCTTPPSTISSERKSKEKKEIK